MVSNGEGTNLMPQLIAYGARCVWWDSVNETKTLQGPTGHGIPCCPHCSGVLFQMDEIEWNMSIEEYENTHKGYRDFTNWRRGKCHQSLKDAAREYATSHLILDIDVLETLRKLV